MAALALWLPVGTWARVSRPEDSTPILFLILLRHKDLSPPGLSFTHTPSECLPCAVLILGPLSLTATSVFSLPVTSKAVSQRTGDRLLLSWVEKCLGTHVVLERPLMKTDVCGGIKGPALLALTRITGV